MPYALLTVDLHSADSKKRQSFADKMKAEKWTELKQSTAWRAKFEDEVSVTACVRVTKSDVAAAARKADISTYDGVVNISDEVPSSFSS